MRLPLLLALLGFILIIAATFCPMLRPFGLFNWDVYHMNRPYGMVILLVAVIGILGTVLNQPKILRLAAYASAVLIVLLYIAALLKVNTTFSFIPFKSLTAFLARQIKFKWGWYVLFAGAAMAVLGALLSRTPKAVVVAK
ncbi:hypothetical protein FFF34_006940 [Inquilinus sp. KBS0705]|nr:hypothetical protein FFF34_006940 [Inquilinus sp. KBS0705]